MNVAQFLILLFLVGFCVSWLLTRMFCSGKRVNFLIDIPNERSLHEYPVPRSGGIAILISLIVTIIFSFIFIDLSEFLVVYLGAFLLSIISFYDDKNHIQAQYRLLSHTVISFSIVFIFDFSLIVLRLPGVEWELPYFWGGLLCVVSTIWLINLYNFMDGMDGFASGMAIIGFSTLAILGIVNDQLIYATGCISIVAAVAGFYIFNFPPAKIFMGDSGASVLGLLVATFIIWADRHQIFPAWIGVLIFSAFIVDATATLMRRAINREKVWQAHRTHYYQKLVQLGWGHKKTVMFEYLLMLSCGFSAILASLSSVVIQWIMIAVWVCMYAGLIFILNVYLSRYSQEERFKSN